jgi:hypothetical protein
LRKNKNKQGETRMKKTLSFAFIIALAMLLGAGSGYAGMDHGGMDQGDMDHQGMDQGDMDHQGTDPGDSDHQGTDPGDSDHQGTDHGDSDHQGTDPGDSDHQGIVKRSMDQDCIVKGSMVKGSMEIILDGTPFEVAGTVVSLMSGKGMVIAIDEGDVTVYGVGPSSYWEKVGVDRPVVGDMVLVSGYTVDYSGVLINIAMAITVDDTLVQLRDPDTGVPLWKGGKKSKQ